MIKATDLVNLFKNLNEAGHISHSLNAGILGKLELVEEEMTLVLLNTILTTILHGNLDQKGIAVIEKSIPRLCSEAKEVHNLVIMVLALSKLHSPPLKTIETIFLKVKELVSEPKIS